MLIVWSCFWDAAETWRGTASGNTSTVSLQERPSGIWRLVSQPEDWSSVSILPTMIVTHVALPKRKFCTLKQGDLFLIRKLRGGLSDFRIANFSLTEWRYAASRLMHRIRPSGLSCSQLLLKTLPLHLTPDLHKATHSKCMTALMMEAWSL